MRERRRSYRFRTLSGQPTVLVHGRAGNVSAVMIDESSGGMSLTFLGPWVPEVNERVEVQTVGNRILARVAWIDRQHGRTLAGLERIADGSQPAKSARSVSLRAMLRPRWRPHVSSRAIMIALAVLAVLLAILVLPRSQQIYEKRVNARQSAAASSLDEQSAANGARFSFP